MKTWTIGLIMLTLALAGPAVVQAHKGHAHKVMGTVSSIDGKNLMVKTTDGKTVMVTVDAKTKVTQGKAKVELTAVKVGDRVVAEGPEEKKMIMATSLQLGTTTATPGKK